MLFNFNQRRARHSSSKISCERGSLFISCPLFLVVKCYIPFTKYIQRQPTNLFRFQSIQTEGWHVNKTILTLKCESASPFPSYKRSLIAWLGEITLYKQIPVMLRGADVI